MVRGDPISSSSPGSSDSKSGDHRDRKGIINPASPRLPSQHPQQHYQSQQHQYHQPPPPQNQSPYRRESPVPLPHLNTVASHANTAPQALPPQSPQVKQELRPISRPVTSTANTGAGGVTAVIPPLASSPTHCQPQNQQHGQAVGREFTSSRSLPRHGSGVSQATAPSAFSFDVVPPGLNRPPSGTGNFNVNNRSSSSSPRGGRTPTTTTTTTTVVLQRPSQRTVEEKRLLSEERQRAAEIEKFERAEDGHAHLVDGDDNTQTPTDSSQSRNTGGGGGGGAHGNSPSISLSMRSTNSVAGTAMTLNSSGQHYYGQNPPMSPLGRATTDARSSSVSPSLSGGSGRSIRSTNSVPPTGVSVGHNGNTSINNGNEGGVVRVGSGAPGSASPSLSMVSHGSGSGTLAAGNTTPTRRHDWLDRLETKRDGPAPPSPVQAAAASSANAGGRITTNIATSVTSLSRDGYRQIPQRSVLDEGLGSDPTEDEVSGTPQDDHYNYNTNPDNIHKRQKPVNGN
jgi:hypothetical protein